MTKFEAGIIVILPTRTEAEMNRKLVCQQKRNYIYSKKSETITISKQI